MEQKILSYRDLEVWQRGIQLTKQLYIITNTFPNHEQHGLTSQIRRAAVSVPSNIAEGYVRNSTKEFIHFLYISLGSLAELNTQIEIAFNLNYIDNVAEIKQYMELQMKQIRSFINALKKRL